MTCPDSFPPIHLIHVTVLNSFQRKPTGSIFCRARIRASTCLNLTTKTCSVSSNVQQNPASAEDIQYIRPRGTATTISRCAGALVYSGDPAAVIGGVIWSLSVGLQSFQCDGLSADGCWPRDSLSTERNNEPLSCRTLLLSSQIPPAWVNPSQNPQRDREWFRSVPKERQEREGGGEQDAESERGRNSCKSNPYTFLSQYSQLTVREWFVKGHS